MANAPIYLSRYDHHRLRDLVASEPRSFPSVGLAGELGRAVVLPNHARIPSTVVTMDSRVVLTDTRTGETREVVLVLPEHRHSTDDAVSVLDELGTALLGCSIGDVITVNESGRTSSLRLTRVVQSSLAEAAGRLTVDSMENQYL